MIRRILQVHKIFDGKTPLYLKDKLPPARNLLVNLANVFKEIKYGTQRYLNSFFPDATKNWNNVITDFNDLPTFEKLKKHLISLYRPEIKQTFNIHNPHLRYIFQLRVGLSHLRYHKKRHHFIDTPSDKCSCGKGVENTHHFLVTCPFFSTHRDKLFTSVETTLHRKDICLMTVNDFVELLLYGHPSLDDSENGSILIATLEFITNSKRFAK